MEKAITFLSGQVPGGILVLLLVLLVINLIFSFFKSSKLTDSDRSRKGRWVYSLSAIMIYIAVWLATQPPKPQIRLIVLPEQPVESGKLTSESFEFTEGFQRTALTHLNKRYLLHRWQWMFETIGQDSSFYYANWVQLAKALKAGALLIPRKEKESYRCVLVLGKDSTMFRAPTLSGVLKQVARKSGLFKAAASFPEVSADYLLAKTELLKKRLDHVIQLTAHTNDPRLLLCRAAAFVKKGMQKKIDRERAKYVPVTNPDFIQANTILIQSIKDKSDTPETAYWLGQIAIYNQNFTKAEVFLKKALVEDPTNPRIHLALSYLLPERLHEFGYQTRVDILKKAVYLDPGFREAVYQLADEYYTSGSGTETGYGTTQAKKVIENFLKIKKNDVNILSLLGSIELKLDHFDEALAIYSKLRKMLPNHSNSYYNLGIVYFMKKEYKTALPYFLKAIQMDHNLDSYLYAGLTYRMLGDNQKALEYYRERVRRKTGDDDKWAKEAMKGIRIILADTTTHVH